MPIFLQFIVRSSEQSPFTSFDQHFLRIYLPHACYMPNQSHISWFDDPVNIWCIVISSLIGPNSPTHFYLFSLGFRLLDCDIAQSHRGTVLMRPRVSWLRRPQTEISLSVLACILPSGLNNITSSVIYLCLLHELKYGCSSSGEGDNEVIMETVQQKSIPVPPRVDNRSPCAT